MAKNKKQVNKIAKLYLEDKKEEGDKEIEKAIKKPFKEVIDFFLSLGYKIRELEEENKGISEDSYY